MFSEKEIRKEYVVMFFLALNKREEAGGMEALTFGARPELSFVSGV